MLFLAEVLGAAAAGAGEWKSRSKMEEEGAAGAAGVAFGESKSEGLSASG